MEENNFFSQNSSEENLDIHSDFPEQKIELLKEEVSVGKKQEVERFIFEKKVESYTENIPVELLSEEIEVKRIPINKDVESYPATRVENGTTIISVVREVPVVTKKLVLVEEIHITKHEHTEKKVISESVREEKFSTNFNQ